MNILVTGGAGFIGSHIVDRYLAGGHRVTVLDNLSTGLRENLNPQAEFVEADLRDRDAVRLLLQSGQFDLINHHAAQLDVRVSVRNPQFDAEVNIIGALNLLQSAVESGVRHVIFASSAGTVYGEQEYFPADELHPTNPISPYGVAKLTVEKYLHYYRHVAGLNYVVLRYTNVYGPRQNPHGEAGVVAIFCQQMLRRQNPVMYGDGQQTRDYVFALDVANANQLAQEYLAAGRSGVFNICTNTEVTVNELFHLLNQTIGSDCLETHAPARAGEQLRSVCTYQRAQQELGWNPSLNFEEGILETVSFFRKNN
ncbi:MAG: NAD-dependent epimerase/dehydratase family protein [Chlorobi bacterium]|nr:MAG: UDP-glucose 4-epimerase [Chlorobi bacterium OLB7]MBK8911891.1 NAD-dependent epimerase/dehydratase family protein [Chlorobiota bacterium]MBX7215468.1 NAD-dependent epimerase/dehydratase family protein [Candidatus Kapabacteria bacterium]